MTLQEQHDAKRKQYLASEISHSEFYLWLADSIGIRIHDLPVKIERVKASTDPHLNDIPLQLWDRMDYLVRRLAVQHGMRSWSLSDTVCVLKAFAKRAASQMTEQQWNAVNGVSRTLAGYDTCLARGKEMLASLKAVWDSLTEDERTQARAALREYVPEDLPE